MSDAKTLKVVCAVLQRDGKYLVAQRPQGKHLAGKWEFPGGKVDPGETPEQALKREIKEELDVEIVVGDLLTVVRHEYAEGFEIELMGYACVLVCGEPRAVEHEGLFWGSLEELLGGVVELGEADLKIAKNLRFGN